ncbi:hypothetical protein ACTXG7_13600 [Mycolicibacterium sp. Dal123E01]|uniref:hypothetical protein n=1 Tax=Mycolicibacterium sp. Dal123E01 TaxID=3457578 RepID=UPI00403E4F3A
MSISITRPARVGLVASTAIAVAIGLVSPPPDVTPRVPRVEIHSMQLEALVSVAADAKPAAASATIDGWIAGWLGFATYVVLTPVFFPVLWVGTSLINKINGRPLPSLIDFIPQYLKVLRNALSEAVGIPAAAQNRSAAAKTTRSTRPAAQSPVRPSRKAAPAKTAGEKKSGRGASARPGRAH